VFKMVYFLSGSFDYVSIILFLIVSMFGVSMEHVVTTFQAYLVKLGSLLGRVKFDIDSIEHQPYGSTREKLTFALSVAHFCFVPQLSLQLPLHTWACFIY
jgi:hypothetical protein